MAENDNDWRASLPMEMRTNDVLSRFKDVGSLAKSYLDLNTHMSSTSRVPKADSTNQEEWNSFYKSWGRPEKSDGYSFPELPKEYPLEDNFKSALSGLAHELGLNQKQFNHMITWGLNQSKGIYDAQQTALNNGMAELKRKWGFAADNNMNRARRMIAELAHMNAENPFVKWLEATGNDNNPILLEYFFEASKQLMDDNFVSEEVRQEQSDRASAQRKINEMMADSKGPYFNENDPRHADSVAEVARLYRVLEGEEA